MKYERRSVNNFFKQFGSIIFIDVILSILRLLSTKIIPRQLCLPIYVFPYLLEVIEQN